MYQKYYTKVLPVSNPIEITEATYWTLVEKPATSMHGRLFNRLPKAKDNDIEEHGHNGVVYEVDLMPTNSLGFSTQHTQRQNILPQPSAITH